MRIRILHLIKVMHVYLRPVVHFEPPSLHCEHPLWAFTQLLNWSSMRIRLWLFDAYPDPAVKSDADSDQASRKRCGSESGSATLAVAVGTPYLVPKSHNMLSDKLVEITVPKLENHWRFYILYPVRYAIWFFSMNVWTIRNWCFWSNFYIQTKKNWEVGKSWSWM